ncbi:hypothetical protein [cyanobacterium endosymbiont of Epithemia turgida]|uniref:hypothetical protein n=1 Tax=cyanobacterium endosymbiont of Epithemia turgida TaxID=718217 RepID=UPI0005C4DE79|nr:hypothetical protein [cyanobacterium endosymbiont of Epithemia turgida]
MSNSLSRQIILIDYLKYRFAQITEKLAIYRGTVKSSSINTVVVKQEILPRTVIFINNGQVKVYF